MLRIVLGNIKLSAYIGFYGKINQLILMDYNTKRFFIVTTVSLCKFPMDKI